MKLLYVVNQFPKLSESFVINELYELDKRDHDVAVFATEQPDKKITHTEIQEMDITVYYGEDPSFRSFPDLFSKYVLNKTVLKETLFIDDPTYHAYCLHLGKQIAEVVEAEGGVNVIHSHFATPSRLPITYAASYHQIPCTVTAHAHEIFSPTNLRRLRRVCSRFDHVIVPSKYNKRYLHEKLGIETDISVVPATTSVDKFEPSDECVSNRLLTVARLTEKKGYMYAIDAVASLVRQGYDVEYHIIGTGEQESALRERVQEHGIDDNVMFLGHVSDEQLINELHDAAVFVLPCIITSTGDRDITPVALREAMATQTACVSTTISAIPEVITHEKDGILVEPNDSEAVAEAIGQLLDNPSYRRRLAANARMTIESKFDITIVTDDLIGIFTSVEK